MSTGDPPFGPGVGAMCPRCGSLYCPTPGVCNHSQYKWPTSDAQILNELNDLKVRVAVLEAVQKPDDGAVKAVSWKEMYEDAERRVKYWHRKYDESVDKRVSVERERDRMRVLVEGFLVRARKHLMETWPALRGPIEHYEKTRDTAALATKAAKIEETADVTE